MIKTYSINDDNKWKEIVSSFDNADIYYSLEYVRALYSNGDGEPLLIYYSDGYTEIINVVLSRVIEVKLNNQKYFDVITPYGYGGFLLKGNRDFQTLTTFINEYRKFMKLHKFVSEFVRFNPVICNSNVFSDVIDVTFTGSTVYIDCRDKNLIWSSFSSKNRNVIRKAIKNNVQIYYGKSEELINSFKKMYRDTMIRDNADKYYLFSDSYFDNLFYDMKYSSIIFYAEHNGNIVSMATIIYDERSAHYHLSGNKREYNSLSASNLMLYEASLYLNHIGVETLHLGGGLGGKKDNLYKFKKSFNRNNDLEYYNGKIVFDSEIYEELCNLKKIDKTEDGFFPLYRLGD